MSSIIDRNIKELEKKLTTNLQYRDLDYRALAVEEITLTGSAVLINDLRLWLQSQRGDYYRQPEHGGFFDDNLRRYELSPNGEDIVKKDLLLAISLEFPSVEIIELDVTADVPRRGWVINIIIRDRLTGGLGMLTEGYEVPE